MTGRIVQSGNNFRKVSKIFITHIHSDHTDGLATLLNSQWENQPNEPIDIYGSGVDALVKGAMAYLEPNVAIRYSEGKKRSMADTFHAHEVQPGVIYQDANVKVTAVRTHIFIFSRTTRPTANTSLIHIASIRPTVSCFSPAIPSRRTRSSNWRKAPTSM